MAAEAVSPVMARLSAYMSEARSRALPEQVLEKTKHHVLDTVAAMVSGAELPPGRAAIEFARGYGGSDPGLATA
jgi:2-methylcitrate dehydratase PrpD